MRKQKYEPKFKSKVLHLHLKAGHTLMSPAQEYKM